MATQWLMGWAFAMRGGKGMTKNVGQTLIANSAHKGRHIK